MGFRSSITLARAEVFPISATGGNSPNMALGKMPTRPALLVKLSDKDGCYGWGEVWANFPPRANQHKAHLIEDVVSPHLIGQSFLEPQEVCDMLREKLSVYFLHIGQRTVFEHILAGLDTALWDLALRHAGVSFAEFMALPKASAQSYATSINEEDLETLIPHHAALGQSHFKLKIGFADHGTRAIVERAADLCPDGARIMVDSNQSWTLEEATSALEDIEPFDPYFAEECLRADAPLSEWDALARTTKIPLAGGENIYGVDDFLTMTRAGLTVLQPDVAKWGGVTGALALARAVPDDIAIWPHFMGTAVGQVAALSISAALGNGSACEMDVNANALRSELCGNILSIAEGRVALPSAPGLVVPPTDENLSRFSDQRG